MTEQDKPAGLTADDINHLLEQFEASDWRELDLRVGDTHLFVSKDGQARGIGRGPSAAPAPPSTAAASVPEPATAAPSAPAPQTAAGAPDHWVAVKAPNLGTFYRSPKPGAPPYVEEGQTVEADTEVCLIEVMKLFTPVTGGVAGTVRRICVSDGEMVEHDQPLLYIEPA
ncbi:acetyl-CoA carboxylase biotin carboxyl carrier protein [Salinisphaera sp. P385]|uniref:Biotin carboxyl carrier protein of acetyl-CoA carboxylase n=1 Tax=Spectribacter acetivorans TaxID=3075603 RepID=A0ABU3B897_9GAMM|nr:acetyl-CoA carboxylase biotin carboxyl carrier protein [Salinisphaera sp. P385]MDT0618698.1 acetyl-CoA carboxylase biotin carboxyl carrier protein [Salinisphaera sp. P385]